MEDSNLIRLKRKFLLKEEGGLYHSLFPSVSVTTLVPSAFLVGIIASLLCMLSIYIVVNFNFCFCQTLSNAGAVSTAVPVASLQRTAGTKYLEHNVSPLK